MRCQCRIPPSNPHSLHCSNVGNMSRQHEDVRSEVSIALLVTTVQLGVPINFRHISDKPFSFACSLFG
uniref:Uncharacterized protein n=1 Tax=Helianthus annuus TaxID=4232 RepID=A0A251SIS4_HELAN